MLVAFTITKSKKEVFDFTRHVLTYFINSLSNWQKLSKHYIYLGKRGSDVLGWLHWIGLEDGWNISGKVYTESSYTKLSFHIRTKLPRKQIDIANRKKLIFMPWSSSKMRAYCFYARSLSSLYGLLSIQWISLLFAGRFAMVVVIGVAWEYN